MSWVRIWVHLVFSTKDRLPYLNSKALREKVFTHIKINVKGKNIWLDTINGSSDHIHCLISLNRDHSISKAAQLIKGESSNWINKNKLINTKFFWQDDYWAVSVSESHLESIRKYIENQDEHHKKKTFEDEINNFMEKYGWSIIKNGRK